MGMAHSAVVDLKNPSHCACNELRTHDTYVERNLVINVKWPVFKSLLVSYIYYSFSKGLMLLCASMNTLKGDEVFSCDI